MNNYYSGKKVLVTGGAGFLGSFLVEKLVGLGANVSVMGRQNNPIFLEDVIDRIDYVKGDIMNMEDCLKACNNQDIIFNLAAVVGGVEFNSKNQGMLYYVNSKIGLNMLEAARICGVNEFQCVSSACVYAKEATVPNPEAEGFLGNPEKTNAGYGWAKRSSELSAMFYAEQYGMKVSIVRPFNLYGPRDDFNPKTSHVIPALIRKVVEAKDKVELWGSGEATRVFVYVKDAVEGLLKTHELYARADPINIGTVEEVSIKRIIETIIKIDGRNLKIENNLTKPEGQKRRVADTKKMIEKLNWKPETPLEEGIRKTMDWYKAQQELHKI